MNDEGWYGVPLEGCSRNQNFLTPDVSDRQKSECPDVRNKFL